MGAKQKNGIKKYSPRKHQPEIQHALTLIQKEIDRVDSDMGALRPIGKQSDRYISRVVVQSIGHARQLYPMVLDLQNDGAFSSATYPSRIPNNKLKDVAVVLAHENYRTRYGKFMIDFMTREVKFRVFQSSAEISRSVERSCNILRVLPVKMLDKVSHMIDGIIDGDKNECVRIKGLIEKGTVESIDGHLSGVKKQKVSIKSSVIK